jgi:response regulator RpfG family c-di-GMP phosphodiesterase
MGWFKGDKDKDKGKGGVRVLCVDDEPKILEAIARDLSRDHTVFTAVSGAEGLETLKRERDITVVISDMMMPEMSGAEFLARVREKFPETARILVTGHADITAAAEAVNRGEIFRFLLKPCDRADLKAAVKEASDHLKTGALEREF